MQPEEQQSRSGRPKLKLKNIPTKSRFLLEKESGVTPLTSALSLSTNQADETLEAFMDKYELLQRIGQGANGVVYKCRHKKLDKVFAVKKSRAEIEFIPHLKASYNHTKMLEHENIINYKGLYIARQKGVSYLVMEYFEYPELCKVKIRDQSEVSDIAYQLLEAVAYMHDNRVCHRDIKPDNILYDQKTGKIKVMDFGESKATRDGRLIKLMMTCTGTLQYKAPELFRGGGYDELIDEWAVGVTIYELLTGRKPFDSDCIGTIVRNIQNCRVSFDEEFWGKHPGRWAKQLILQLLCPRDERITSANALKSLWFEGHASTLKSITINSAKRHSEITFESMANNKYPKEDIKKSMNLIMQPLRVTGGQIINSDEEYISDEDEQPMEDKKQEIKEDENKEVKEIEYINLQSSSTECKSPLFIKEQETEQLKVSCASDVQLEVPKLSPQLECSQQY